MKRKWYALQRRTHFPQVRCNVGRTFSDAEPSELNTYIQWATMYLAPHLCVAISPLRLGQRTQCICKSTKNNRNRNKFPQNYTLFNIWRNFEWDLSHIQKPSPAKADARDYLIIVLVYENKLVVVKIIRDGVSEADNMPVIYICGVYSPPLKLTNESLVVIGTHTCPATITNLAVENVY